MIAATDYIRLYADQIRPYIDAPYTVLGTDGFGRSDTREQLRHFFEVDAKFIVLAAVDSLVKSGALPADTIKKVMKKYNIDSKKLDPMHH